MSLVDDFDAWARLSARLLRRTAIERARIIHDANAEAHWEQADRHWCDALMADMQAGRMDRVDKYRLLCVEAMGTRRRSGETVPSPLDALRSRGAAVAARRDSSVRDSAPEQGNENAAIEQARQWPVEQYAWLCAELEHYPQRIDHVWGTRGITTVAAQRMVQSLWGAKLEADGQLRGRYDELLRGYREVIRRR